MANEFVARKGLLISGSTKASGSITAFSFTGSILADNGIISSSTQFNSLNSPFTGSFTGSLKGSLTGTGSWASSASVAISSSYALTASYALNGGTGTAGNSFVTFSIAGQNNVIADSSNDTLTLVAGSGISLTSDASTDAITITATAASPQAFNIDTYEFIGDGTTTDYNIVNSYIINSLIVSVDGITYMPSDDYTISTNTLTFISAPPSQSNILVRAFVNATTGVTGSFSGSFSGVIASSSFATTASYALTSAGTITNAVSSSYALTASYALNGGSGGTGAGFPYTGNAVITGSLWVSGSSGGLGGVTGSFLGSFTGDGSNLQNVPAAVVLEIDGGFASSVFDGTDIIFDGGGA